MFRTISISSLILLFAVIFYIFSPTIFGLYFLIAILVFLSSLVLAVYFTKKHVQFTLSTPAVMTKNDTQQWTIHSTNNSKWFTATIKAHVTWEHLFTKQRYTKIISCTIPANKTVTATVQPIELFSGQYDIQLETIEFTDALTLFSAKKQSVCKQLTVVLPNASIQQATHTHEKNSAQLQSATTVTQQNGDELTHLKLYHPGDSVKQIHWKLSSKLDELYVKQLETTTGQQFIIAIDATEMNKDIELYDQLMEAAASQLLSSILNGRFVQLAFYENSWQLDDVTNETQAKAALQKLLIQTAQSLAVSTDAWQQLLQRYPNALLLTTNHTRSKETNVRAIQRLQGKDELTNELDDK